jgi:Tfp pilus assembly protein PilF
MSDMTKSLEAMLARGADSASLRFALATRYLNEKALEPALAHAELAVQLDADYSAAWRLLGRIQTELGRPAAAIASYRRGIEVADKKGDQQVAKEMRVFLKRLERAADNGD